MKRVFFLLVFISVCNEKAYSQTIKAPIPNNFMELCVDEYSEAYPRPVNWKKRIVITVYINEIPNAFESTGIIPEAEPGEVIVSDVAFYITGLCSRSLPDFPPISEFVTESAVVLVFHRDSRDASDKDFKKWNRTKKSLFKLPTHCGDTWSFFLKNRGITILKTASVDPLDIWRDSATIR